MKTLYVHRHAKSDWESSARNDHDRPLNARGRRDAAFMAAAFSSKGSAPDLLLSSTADRAAETMAYYKVALKMDTSRVRFEKSIYHADVHLLMKLTSSLEDSLGTVMIFGHNPTFTDLCHHLDHTFRDYLVTCSCVKIELDIDSWAELYENCGNCISHMSPKNSTE